MKKMLLSIFLAVILIANLVLLAFGRNNIWVFWGVVIISAIVAYWVLPKMKG